MRGKQLLIVSACVITFIVMTFLIFHFRLETNSYRKELSEVKKSSPMKANQEFIEKFFSYKSAKERYENLESMMTQAGFRSTFPSGSELPEGDQSVQSSIKNLVCYENSVSKTEVYFMNEFTQTTSFKGVDSTQSILIKTKLLFQGQAWKIDDVEYIAQTSYQP